MGIFSYFKRKKEQYKLEYEQSKQEFEAIRTSRENNKTKLPKEHFIDYGMYFIDLFEQDKHSYKSEIYFTLGCVCQGRIDEIDDFYNELDEYDFDLNLRKQLLRDKNELYKLANIVKKIEDSEMNDIRNNESKGEYINRTLSKMKTFINGFEYLRNNY